MKLCAPHLERMYKPVCQGCGIPLVGIARYHFGGTTYLCRSCFYDRVQAR